MWINQNLIIWSLFFPKTLKHNFSSPAVQKNLEMRYKKSFWKAKKISKSFVTLGEETWNRWDFFCGLTRIFLIISILEIYIFAIFNWNTIVFDHQITLIFILSKMFPTTALIFFLLVFPHSKYLPWSLKIVLTSLWPFGPQIHMGQTLKPLGSTVTVGWHQRNCERVGGGTLKGLFINIFYMSSTASRGLGLRLLLLIEKVYSFYSSSDQFRFNDWVWVQNVIRWFIMVNFLHNQFFLLLFFVCRRRNYFFNSLLKERSFLSWSLIQLMPLSFDSSIWIIHIESFLDTTTTISIMPILQKRATLIMTPRWQISNISWRSSRFARRE